MEVVLLLSPNIALSKITLQERWYKLYRKIHTQFLSKEFVHVDDYKAMYKQLNARILQLEQKINTNLQNIKTQIDSHTHVAPQAPGGAIPTNPPSAPLTVDTSPVKEAPYIDAAMQAENSAWLAMPQALAPMGDGLSTQASQASLQASSDILIGG